MAFTGKNGGYWVVGSTLGIGLNVLDNMLIKCKEFGDDAFLAMNAILRQWRNGSDRGDDVRCVLAEMLIDRGLLDDCTFLVKGVFLCSGTVCRLKEGGKIELDQSTSVA